ncbi:MAG: uroporphyrinogen decarboxylase [Alphaproteobacteria bacterium]|nr:uroporphyrinogen decarboxylase [Alphaproteobacteria bacterium]
MKKLAAALKGIQQNIPPIWLMRQAGRYLPEYQLERTNFPNFMDFCLNPEAAAKVTLQPIQRFDFDAAIIFSDILTIPHFLGQTVHFEPGNGPRLKKVGSERVDWDSFLDKAEDIEIQELMTPVLEAIQNVRGSLCSSKSLIGFAGSPWTIATYMLRGGKTQDFSGTVQFAKQLDGAFDRLIRLLENNIVTLLIQQIQAGCDVVQIFDSWAHVVPLLDRPAWLWRPLQRIIHAIRQSYPDVPIIYYGKGVADHYPALAQMIPNLAFGIDHSVDCAWARDNVQSVAPVQGNLSPEKLMAGGFETDVDSILEKLSDGPFIFNLGHGILPKTPIAHVEALIKQVRNPRC